MEDFRQLAAEVDALRREQARIPVREGGRLSSILAVCGVLTSAINPASPDGKTGGTTFTFKEWRFDTTDTHTPRYRVEDTTDTTGINRSQMAASAGKFVICLMVDGELQPIWTDC